MAKKSFFNNFMGLFSLKNKKSGTRNISAGKAIDLQNAYISSTQNQTEVEMLPYGEIIKQLYSPKEEVFTASLYYLKKIAENEPDEVQDILSELNTCLSKKNKLPSQNIQQIELTINDIKELHRF